MDEAKRLIAIRKRDREIKHIPAHWTGLLDRRFLLDMIVSLKKELREARVKSYQKGVQDGYWAAYFAAQRDGHAEGYADGYQDGRQDGYDSGYDEGTWATEVRYGD